jgi:hypothetical protein
MSSSRPAPVTPPPPPVIEDTAATAQQYQDQLRRRRGRAASILTDRTAGAMQPMTAAKTLLGS